MCGSAAASAAAAAQPVGLTTWTMYWCGTQPFGPWWKIPVGPPGGLVTRCFQDTVIQIPLDAALWALCIAFATYYRRRRALLPPGRAQRSSLSIGTIVMWCLLAMLSAVFSIVTPFNNHQAAISTFVHFTVLAFTAATFAFMTRIAMKRGLPVPLSVRLLIFVRIPFSGYQMYTTYYYIIENNACICNKVHAIVFSFYLLACLPLFFFRCRSTVSAGHSGSLYGDRVALNDDDVIITGPALSKWSRRS